jgi:hypothetical protein
MAMPRKVSRSAAWLRTVGGVFADAAGEHERVQSAGRRGHRGDAGGESVGVDVDGEDRVELAVRRGGLDLAHVAGAGEGDEPGSVFQCGGDLVWCVRCSCSSSQSNPGSTCRTGSP